MGETEGLNVRRVSMTMNGNKFSIHKISNAHHFLRHNFEKSREGERLKVRMNVSKGRKN